MNEIRFTTYWSAEDECWLTEASGFSNGQITMAHGEDPIEALRECMVSASLILKILQR
jgi:hypothetical protein